MFVHHLDNLCYFENFSSEERFERVHQELFSPNIIFLYDESGFEVLIDLLPVDVVGSVDNDFLFHWSGHS